MACEKDHSMDIRNEVTVARLQRIQENITSGRWTVIQATEETGLPVSLDHLNVSVTLKVKVKHEPVRSVRVY